MQIKFNELDPKKIDILEPLWEELNLHHQEKSPIYKSSFEKFTFAARRERLLTPEKELLILTAVDNGVIVGYCISSISNQVKGEIESIYIKPDYRKAKIGAEFMIRSLNWLDDNEITEISIHVAVGNEDALPFYRKFGFVPKTYKLKRPI